MGNDSIAVPVGVLVAQVFTFEGFAWDVVKANRLVDSRTTEREPITLPLGQLVRNFLGADGKGGQGGRIEIDPARAMSAPDTGRLPLVVLYPLTGLAIPIDGWQRIYKAWKLGYDTMPAHLLTLPEEYACRVSL